MLALDSNAAVSQTAVAHIDTEKVGEYFALFSLGLYLVARILFFYSTLTVSFPALEELGVLQICESIAWAFAIAAIAMRPHHLIARQYILAVVALAILWYSATLMQNYQLLYGYVLLFALAGIDLKKVCQIYYVLVMALVIALMVLSVLGVVYNKDVFVNDRLVFSYGFNHPNTPGAFIFSAIGAMAYTCWDKKTWLVPMILAVLSAVFSYAFLSARTSSIILVLLALVILLGHFKVIERIVDRGKNVFFVLLIILPLALMVFILACTAFYTPDNSFLAWFNKALSGRFELAHAQYVNLGGFTVFGQQAIDYAYYRTGGSYIGIDIGYSFFALADGLAVLAAIGATYYATLRVMMRDGFHVLIIGLFAINALFFAIENCPLIPVFSIAFFFLSVAYTDLGDSLLPESSCVAADGD